MLQDWTALKKPKISNIIVSGLLFTVLVIVFNAPFVSAAGENGSTNKKQSTFDRIWSLATLYKNEDNAVLQEFAFSGRYQGQYYWVEGDTGKDHGWENRRLRLAFRGRFARQFSFRAEADFDTDADPWYTGLTEAWVDWEQTEKVHLAAGKIMVRFTQEGSTSFE